MAELGLFTAANPVTANTPAQAVADAVMGTACGRLRTYVNPAAHWTYPRKVGPVPDLPPELQGLGLERFHDYLTTHTIRLGSSGDARFCNATIGGEDPWIAPDTGRLLVAEALGPDPDHPGEILQGPPLLAESPCVLGFGRGEYRVYDLTGRYVCSQFTTATGSGFPNIDAKYLKPDPGSGLRTYGYGGGFPNVRGGGPRLKIGGVNPADVLNFLQGGGVNVDLSGVITVLAALVAAGGDIKGSLDSLPPGFGDALAPALGNLATSLDNVLPGVGGRLAAALADQGDKTQGSTWGAHAAGAAAAPDVVTASFQALARETPGLLGKLADVYKGALDRLIAAMLDLFRDDIEAHAPVTPANVDKVAAAALRSALTAGSVAQLSGMALELLHPIKNMGVQQAIGILATFAGFEEIAKPFFGATLRYGIGLPAEHRAAAHFRSVLPPLETVRELAAAGLLKLDKYHQRLELAGFPEPYPAALADIVYTPPPARFLANMLDGSESDRPWLAGRLRRLGFSPEDTERAVRALELKTTAPGRGKVVSVLLAEYQAGRLAAGDLDAGLAGAGLSVTHRAYYRRAADLERRGAHMEGIAAAVLTQYVNEVVSAAVVRQELAALGFPDEEITVRLTTADLKRGISQVKAEVKGLETELTALKREGLTLATRQLRAGFLSPAAFLAVGQGMGYSRQLLEVAAGTALLQGAPTTTAQDPAIGLGALQETQGRIAELIAAEVAAKRTDRVAALAALVGLGLPTDLATILTDLAGALAGPSPFAGDFGMPAGAAVGGAFAAIAADVAAGLQGAIRPGDILGQVLQLLGLPGRDRTALVGLIRDLQTLFGK